MLTSNWSLGEKYSKNIKSNKLSPLKKAGRAGAFSPDLQREDYSKIWAWGQTSDSYALKSMENKRVKTSKINFLGSSNRQRKQRVRIA